MKKYIQPTITMMNCPEEDICAADVSIMGDNSTWDDEW